MASIRQKTLTPLRPIFTISVVLILILLSAPALSAAYQFQVIRVTDGDTIKVKNNGKTVVIRLVGIDAPETSKRKNEPGQPFSRKSSQHLAGLVLNKPVKIQSYGTDRYGRTLGVVYCNGINVNLEMVKAGLAEVYRGRPSKGFDNDPYLKAEKDAQRSGRGMWSLGDRYVSPREWRRMGKKLSLTDTIFIQKN